MRGTIVTVAFVVGAHLPATAGDVLVRETMSFERCVDVQDVMLANLGLSASDLTVRTDTGAVLERAYEGTSGTLVLTCNRVTRALVVERDDPDRPGVEERADGHGLRT